MAAFFWSIGPSNGSLQIMELTIVGEVTNLLVTSSAQSLNQPIAVPDFKPCIPTQTVACGPVPLSFLPLTANAFLCGALEGQPPNTVPSATSQSPTDPIPVGSNPFCPALTSGGTVTTTFGGGGSTMTPQEMCAAAQNSAALSTARSAFVSACAMLRMDQANVTADAGAAAALQAAAGAAAAASAIASLAWFVALAFGIVATILGGLAIVFSILAGEAAKHVGIDESLMDSAQQAWESAVAAVRTACCPGWITINTADLVCA